MEEYLDVMRKVLCLILAITTLQFVIRIMPKMIEQMVNTIEQNEETVSSEMPDPERYKKYENENLTGNEVLEAIDGFRSDAFCISVINGYSHTEYGRTVQDLSVPASGNVEDARDESNLTSVYINPADSYSGQLLYDDTGKTVIGLSFLKTASAEDQEEEPLTTPVEEQKEESLIINRIILGFLVAFALVGVLILLAPFLEAYDSSMKEQTMEEQVEDYRQYKQEQKNKQKQEKMEQLSDRIMACLESRFGTESLTYAKYESAVRSAMEQYQNNLESIKSYRQLIDSVSSEKQGKIQPLIDNLKAQNKDLYSRMEDLYISLETDRENDTDESIQRLQEVTEQLKYYKS